MYTLTWSLVPSINYIYIKLQGKVLQWIMSVRHAHTGPEYRARSACRGIYSGPPKRFYLATMTTQSKLSPSPSPPPHMAYRSYEMEQGFNCAFAAAILTSLWTPLSVCSPPHHLSASALSLLPLLLRPLQAGPALWSGLVCACLADITHCSIFLFNLICSIYCCL